MERQRWEGFRDTYPELSERILVLGTKLYELGVDGSRNRPELAELVTCIADAPKEAREMLGITERSVSSTTVLEAIFERGSSLLLDYVRTGNC